MIVSNRVLSAIKKTTGIAFGASLFLVASNCVAAEESKGRFIFEYGSESAWSKMDSAVAEILEGSPDQLVLARLETLKGVFDRVTVWTPFDMPLNVCFVESDADDNAKRKVAEIAKAWEVRGSSIKFNFGKFKTPHSCNSVKGDIRITFRGNGVWSEIGRNSVTYGTLRPSMVLGGFDSSSLPEKEFRRWVLHEFGHALGLYHEHQGPNSNCKNELNLDLLFKEKLGVHPYYWKRPLFDKNMEKIFIKEPKASPFDKQSIMLYTFDSEYYLQGKNSSCYHETNYDISDTDRTFVANEFPGARTPKAKQILEERDDAQKRFDSLISSGTLSESASKSVQDYLQAFEFQNP